MINFQACQGSATDMYFPWHVSGLPVREQLLSYHCLNWFKCNSTTQW